MDPPILMTERLKLAPLTLSDVESLALILTDRDAMWDLWNVPGIPDDAHGFANLIVTESLRSWDESDCGFWGLWTQHTDLASRSILIGYCGFVFEEFAMVVPPDGLEVGWAVRPDYQRKGLALEAACAVIGFGFDNIHVPEQVGITGAQNTPSQMLMERLGFQFKESIDYGRHKNLVFSLSCEKFRSNEYASNLRKT